MFIHLVLKLSNMLFCFRLFFIDYYYSGTMYPGRPNPVQGYILPLVFLMIPLDRLVIHYKRRKMPPEPGGILLVYNDDGSLLAFLQLSIPFAYDSDGFYNLVFIAFL